MDLLILKNVNSTGVLQINDLGIYLNPNETTNLLTNFEDEQVLESLDLQTAMQSDAEVTLNATQLTYQQVVDYFTKLSKYDNIDYAYISAKDGNTDVTSAELERLTNGSDVSSGTALHSHDSRYYTKTELSNSNTGTVGVHWENITNVPAFGSLSWKDSVDRTNSGYGSGTMLPITGNTINDAKMVKDDGDGKPAQYVCVSSSGTWSDQWKKIADVDWGSANAISSSSTGNLTSTNIQSALEELQGDIDGIVAGTLPINHSLDEAYKDGSVITVNGANLGLKLSDTKNFNITDSTGSRTILKTTALAAGDTLELNGKITSTGTLSHTGKFDLVSTQVSSLIVNGADLNLSTLGGGNIVISSNGALQFKDSNLSSTIALSQAGTSGLVGFTSTSLIGALNELKSMDAATTLQQAYEGAAGSGAGRAITADFGAVKITGTNNFAPLELVPNATAPTAGLAAGQIANIAGELYAYDGTRTKWLSMTTMQYPYSASSVSGQMIQIGNTLSSGAGYKMPEKATITKVVVSTDGGNQAKTFELRKNGAATALKTFTLSSGAYTSTNDNIDLAAGDTVQIYCAATGTPAKNVVVVLYIKWRS